MQIHAVAPVSMLRWPLPQSHLHAHSVTFQIWCPVWDSWISLTTGPSRDNPHWPLFAGSHHCSNPLRHTILSVTERCKLHET
jgi:hypothetical protein